MNDLESIFQNVNDEYFLTDISEYLEFKVNKVDALLHRLGGDNYKRLAGLFSRVVVHFYENQLTRPNSDIEETKDKWSELAYHNFTHILTTLITLDILVEQNGGAGKSIDRSVVEYAAASLLIHDISLPDVVNLSDKSDQKNGHESESYDIGEPMLLKSKYICDEAIIVQKNVLATEWIVDHDKLDLGNYLVRISDLFSTLGAENYIVFEDASIKVASELYDAETVEIFREGDTSNPTYIEFANRTCGFFLYGLTTIDTFMIKYPELSKGSMNFKDNMLNNAIQYINEIGISKFSEHEDSGGRELIKYVFQYFNEIGIKKFAETHLGSNEFIDDAIQYINEVGLEKFGKIYMN